MSESQGPHEERQLGQGEQPPADAQRPSRENELLEGKYRVTRLIGRGGMASVYEARHEVIGRRFAIKFLDVKLSLHAQMFARFKREARAAGALENENIAAVTDFGSAADGVPYLVMEYLEGEDLARLLARVGPLPVGRAVNAVIQACRGLEAAHANGIVHRDLKPENLFVARRGDGSDLIKVLDFGIAKLKTTGGDEPSATRTGITMGTALYMPPEQARGQKDIDERADIYALGVILYELLTAQRPHPGGTYNAILYHILTQPAPRLETLRAGLPDGLADLVHRALAFEPEQRFASVREMSAALARYASRSVTPIEDSASSRSTTGPLTRTVTTPVSELELPAQSASPSGAVPSRRSKARRFGLGMIGLLLLLGLIVAGSTLRTLQDPAANAAPPIPTTDGERPPVPAEPAPVAAASPTITPQAEAVERLNEPASAPSALSPAVRLAPEETPAFRKKSAVKAASANPAPASLARPVPSAKSDTDDLYAP